MFDTKEYKGIEYKISVDEYAENPRTTYDNSGRLCIMLNSRYDFINELDWDFHPNFDWDDGHEEIIKERDKKLFDENYIFDLDLYEHSGIVFSITGEGQQCGFDTSKNVGFIAIPKIDVKDKGQAEKLARGELEEYNAYCNGEVYSIDISDIGENVGEYYGYDIAKKEAEAIIDNFLKTHKKYLIKTEMTITREYGQRAENKEDAIETIKNNRLPEGVIDGTLIIK